MAQDNKTIPPTQGYEVEFIPLERRMGDQRAQRHPPKLPPGVQEDRRKKERRNL